MEYARLGVAVKRACCHGGCSAEEREADDCQSEPTKNALSQFSTPQTTANRATYRRQGAGVDRTAYLQSGATNSVSWLSCHNCNCGDYPLVHEPNNVLQQRRRLARAVRKHGT